MTDEKRLPFMRFYWSDWRADPGLRLCSLAARGLWADMLSIMHEAEPYGHLVIRGEKVSVSDLAKITGAKAREIEKLMKELENHAVFSVNMHGIPFSRRMVRDKEKSEKAREFGKAGGNPNIKRAKDLAKETPPAEAQNGIRAGLTPTLNPGLTPTLKPHIPESRVQSSSKGDDDPKPKANPTSDLERLAGILKLDHSAFHRHPKFAKFPAYMADWTSDGCDPALDIWPTITKLAKRTSSITSPAFFDTAIREARDLRLASKPLDRNLWQKRLEGFVKRGNWDLAEWGPKPNEAGCKAPADLVAKIVNGAGTQEANH